MSLSTMAVVLTLTAGTLLSAPPAVPALPVAPVEASAPEEPDPLLEERAALRAEVRGMDEEMTGIHTREIELRSSYRGAIEGGKNLMDPANVDEETGKLILRVQALETELKTLREELTVKLADHPQTIAGKARIDAIQKQVLALRTRRTEIQEQKVKPVGRLRVIEQELAERRKAAAAAEARAKTEADHGAVVEATANEKP